MNSKKGVLHGIELATVNVLEGVDYQAIACDTPSEGLRVWVFGVRGDSPRLRRWINPIHVREGHAAVFDWDCAYPATRINIRARTGELHIYQCKQYADFRDEEKFWQEVNR